MSAKTNSATGAEQRAAAAHHACLLLVEAYARGEAACGSIDWEDVNLAHEKAAQALTAVERRRIARRVQAGLAGQEV